MAEGCEVKAGPQIAVQTPQDVQVERPRDAAASSYAATSSLLGLTRSVPSSSESPGLNCGAIYPGFPLLRPVRSCRCCCRCRAPPWAVVRRNAEFIGDVVRNLRQHLHTAQAHARCRRRPIPSPSRRHRPAGTPWCPAAARQPTAECRSCWPIRRRVPAGAVSCRLPRRSSLAYTPIAASIMPSA